MGAWHAYWSSAGGNILAMPAEAVLAAAAGWLLRRPIRRVIRAAARAWSAEAGKALAEVRAEAAHARRAAELARQIAADTHEHLTGRAHPDAPVRGQWGA